MADMRNVTYCGLYCSLCGERARVPQRAAALRESLAKEGWEQWGREEYPGFDSFWSFLNGLCDPDTACPGCRQGGGPPFCGIRKCAQSRHIDACPMCADYPCEMVLCLAKGYPTLVADGKRMCEIGPEAWILEQEERARTGFAYVDIRCHPYDVPGEPLDPTQDAGA